MTETQLQIEHALSVLRLIEKATDGRIAVTDNAVRIYCTEALIKQLNESIIELCRTIKGV